MAQFLNTIEINLQLERLIKDAKEQLVLISPYLKLNDRMRELLQDKRGQLAEVRIVYGKQELHDSERQWLASQQHIKISFCKNLHGKCYLNELYCIVTSMNLYDFSQVNNNEMGFGVHKNQDKLLYSAVAEEAQRLIRISEEITTENKNIAPQQRPYDSDKRFAYPKLTTARIAEYVGVSIEEIRRDLIKHGCLRIVNGREELTEKGIMKLGGEKRRWRNGTYSLLWDKSKVKRPAAVRQSDATRPLA